MYSTERRKKHDFSNEENTFFCGETSNFVKFKPDGKTKCKPTNKTNTTNIKILLRILDILNAILNASPAVRQ